MTHSIEQSSIYRAVATAQRTLAGCRRRGPDKDVVRAAAHGQWSRILAAAGLDLPINRHMPCPACGGRDRFRYDDRHSDGNFFCSGCGHGDGFGLLMRVHGWSFPAALDFVAGVVGMQPGQQPPPAPAPRRPPEVLRRRNADHLHGALGRLITDDGTVDAYLRGRGLAGLGAARLLLWPDCRHGVSATRWPAMVGILADQAGHVAGIHRTYLDPATASKAPVEPAKTLTGGLFAGAYRGCAIQLFPACGEVLALAEGIETALAVHELTGGDVPVWAAGNTSLLRQVQIPATVRQVQIWADHDINHAGQEAARYLADRLAAAGRRVTIHTPPEPGTDWLDVLVRRGGAQ